MKARCFRIDRLSAGWITGAVTDGTAEILFDNSWMTDFPNDLMLALLTVLGDYPADAHRETFRAELEPAVAEWTLSAEGDDLCFHVTTYEDGSMVKVLSQETVTLNKAVFLRDFTLEMDALLNRFGLLGYRMEWDSEFPLSLYLRIKDIAAGQNTAGAAGAVSPEDNWGTEACASDFRAERAILDSIS